MSSRSGSGKKWLDSGDILNVEPRRFGHGLDVKDEGKKEINDDRWVQGRLELEYILGEEHGFIWGRSSLRCLLDFKQRHRVGRAFGFRGDRGEKEAVRRETRGVVETVSALLTGQVRGRWSTNLGIWGMDPSPKA